MDYITKRVLSESSYVINYNKTIREVASIFNISKSSVHKDLSIRLRYIDKDIYNSVKKIFESHINLRHIKGGESTKRKYLQKNICI